MHLRPRRKLAAQLKTVCRPVTMRVFYHTLVTKRPNYQRNNRNRPQIVNLVSPPSAAFKLDFGTPLSKKYPIFF